MENILNRISQIARHERITITALEQIIGASKGVLSRALAKNTDIQSKWLIKIAEHYPRYNTTWLLSGQEEMLKQTDQRSAHRIPLYKDVDDVEMVITDPEQTYAVSYVDPGDWFPGATAATRYYNTNMKEYPPGSLLILRQKFGVEELVWGEHYVIEYGDNRVMREVQPAEDLAYIYAYSTNEATYIDGRPKYPPVKIPKKQITSIFQVLGHVCKRQDNGRIYHSGQSTS